MKKLVLLFLSFAIGATTVLALGQFVDLKIPAVMEEPKPLADWNKVFRCLKNGSEPNVLVEVAVSVGDDVRSCSVYLVDGQKWYYVSSFVPIGCGGKKEDSRFVFSLKRVEFKEVPSNNTKVVVVGDGKREPELKGVEIFYD